MGYWKTILKGERIDYKIGDGNGYDRVYIYTSQDSYGKVIELREGYRNQNGGNYVGFLGELAASEFIPGKYRLKGQARVQGRIFSNENTFYASSPSDFDNRGDLILYDGEVVDRRNPYSVWGELELYVPTPPASVNISLGATEVREGEKLTISWSGGSGASSFILERQIRTGSWVQIYKGSSKSYVDTMLEGWLDVRYRVKAVNNDGETSYSYSSRVTVTSFPKLYMKVNGSVKTSTDGWVKVNGNLRKIKDIYIKVSGQVKKI